MIKQDITHEKNLLVFPLLLNESFALLHRRPHKEESQPCQYPEIFSFHRKQIIYNVKIRNFVKDTQDYRRHVYPWVDTSVVYRNAEFIVFNIDSIDSSGILIQKMKNLIIEETHVGKENVRRKKERKIY